ncbi:DUF6452 family protein [Flavobacterium sp.]|uniref:DUF6452 family protein n=1 Tax=Flavobacterium sp. TaxID=239 RepID=UPI00286DE0CC|nr:DUF6452 family protein [Flavobacterium sp.]
MKKWKIFFILILIATFIWSCEKDDICEAGTPTTPKMIVEFYDNFNPNSKKTVTDLTIVAENSTDSLRFNGVSKIEIPLKTFADNTKYKFIINDGNPIPSLINDDFITLNYTRKDLFISRACGFKTVFELTNPNGIVLTTDSNNWIKGIDIQQYNILNENEVHAKLFF